MVTCAVPGSRWPTCLYLTTRTPVHLSHRHIGFFDHDHVPVGRGFATSFGYMLGASSHDNRSSQVSHTCGLPVKDLYNSTRIANDPGGYGFNNIYSAEMYGDVAASIVASHDAATPLFLYMAFQDNHAVRMPDL